jgi:uncharacterized protein (TIGR03435 family)
MTSGRQTLGAGAVAALLLVSVSFDAKAVGPPPGQEASTPRPAFENATVVVNKTNTPPKGVGYIFPKGYFSAANVTLRELIQFAYRRHALDRRDIEGGPAWIDTSRFNVDGVAAGGHVLDPDGFPRRTLLMLQSLLAERFRLEMRVESRKVPVYELVLTNRDGRPGPRLRKSDVDCAEAVSSMIQGHRPKANCGFQQYGGKPVPTVLSLADMASLFSELVDRPVLDRTGLAGPYQASIDDVAVRPWGPFDPGYQTSDVRHAMFSAMPKQLGLKLEPRTGTVDVLIIEHADDPNRRETLPLVVEASRVEPANSPTGSLQQITVSLRNTGNRAIVAWGIRTRVELADGTSHPGGLWTDVNDVRDIQPADRRLIPPNGGYTAVVPSFPTNRAAKDVVSVAGEVTFVIFDDDTAMGDERMVRSAFERRLQSQRAWTLIEKAFTDAMAVHADPHAALVVAHQAVETIADESIKKSSAYTWTWQMLESSLDPRYPRDFARALETTVAGIRARRAAADAHHQQRK